MLAALYLYVAARAGGDSAGPPVQWNPGTVKTEVGSSSFNARGLALTLDPGGRGVLVWPLGSLTAGEYPLLELQFVRSPSSLGIFWRTTALGQQMAQYWLPGIPGRSLWLRLGGMAYWSDTLVELALVIKGQPGETIVLENAVLHPSSLTGEFQAFAGNWSRSAGWDHASVNNHTGLGSGDSPIYPVPLAATVLVASLVVYGCMLLAWRHRARFDWRVVGSLFLVCWVALDAVWQGKLLRQLQVTQDRFAGKSSAEKLQVGPDAALVTFMSDVQARLRGSNDRVFVTSASDYAGMRANYYLYPLNVYWQRKGGELPALHLLRSGDYIVQVQPSELRYQPGQQALFTPSGSSVPAQLLGSSGLGALYRVL